MFNCIIRNICNGWVEHGCYSCGILKLLIQYHEHYFTYKITINEITLLHCNRVMSNVYIIWKT